MNHICSVSYTHLKGAPRRKRTPQEIREEMLKRLEESEFNRKD